MVSGKSDQACRSYGGLSSIPGRRPADGEDHPDDSGEAGPAALAALVSLPFQIRQGGTTVVLVISNTFGWPLAGYPAVQRTLRVIASPLFGVISGLASAAALVTHDQLRRGRETDKADRCRFLADLPVPALFGCKNDPYGWQSRFAQISSHTAASGITAGCHFPFNDDPDAYAAAISAWRADKVAASGDNSANLSRS